MERIDLAGRGGDRGAPRVAGAEHASHLVEREERDAVDEGCRAGAGALPAGRVGHQEHEGGVRDQRREKRGQPRRHERRRGGEDVRQTADRVEIALDGMALH